jgi:hypothetical protein
VTEGTIEERIVELQSKKNSLIAGAMGGASKGALQVNGKKSRTPNIVLQSTCHACARSHLPLVFPLTVWLYVLAMSLERTPGMSLELTPKLTCHSVCLCAVGCRSREQAISGCFSLESVDAIHF